MQLVFLFRLWIVQIRYSLRFPNSPEGSERSTTELSNHVQETISVKYITSHLVHIEALSSLRIPLSVLREGRRMMRGRDSTSGVLALPA